MDAVGTYLARQPLLVGGPLIEALFLSPFRGGLLAEASTALTAPFDFIPHGASNPSSLMTWRTSEDEGLRWRVRGGPPAAVRSVSVDRENGGRTA